MTKTIVVTGATGNQGGSVVDTFTNLPDWHVRAITRNPSSPAAQTLQSRGVQVVKADLDDVDSLKTAFQGAHAIFLVTDYWQHANNPSTAAKAAALGKEMRPYAMELEMTQGMNAARAAADSSVLKTLERFVFSSLADVSKWSGGRYTKVYHFDGKARIEDRIRGELPELAERMSTMQAGYYITNWKFYPFFAPAKQADGSFVFKSPFSRDVHCPFVVERRDTGPFVKALVETPAGTDLLGVSQMAAFGEFTEIWGKVLGVKASFEQVPMEEFVTPFPEDFRQILQEIVEFTGELGWTGGDPRVKMPEELGVSIERTSIEEYIKGEDWSEVLGDVKA